LFVTAVNLQNDLKHLRDQYGLLIKYTDISSFQGGGEKKLARVWTVLYGDKTYVIYEGDSHPL
jgi:hypothetical protein